MFSIWTCFFEWENENLKKKSKITKFVINIPKIMKKAKKNSENDPNKDRNWSINFKSRNLE